MSLFRSKSSAINMAWIMAVWSVFATISATMLYIRLGAGEDPPSWASLFAIKLGIWWFWGLLTPFIFYTSKKFRIDRQHRFLGLFYHIPASIILAALNIFLYAVIVVWVNDAALKADSLIPTFVTLMITQFEWYLLIYWGIIIVGYVFEYYRKNREKEIESLQLEARLVKAQLQALKMQLHPHFLFNTLNTIAAQIRLDEKKSAVTMLAGLSDLLRRALQQREKQFLPLSEEIAFIRQYLEIEKVRFKNNLDLLIDIDPRANDLQVPGFLLQPLVENAIYHGLTKKLGASRLEVKAGVADDLLSIIVYNEGPALPEGFKPEHSTGIGLSSTIERLHQVYIKEDTFDMRNARNGVQVTLKLPIQ